MTENRSSSKYIKKALAYLVSGHYKSETFSCSQLLVRQSELVQGIALGCDN
jgi:hypothetical protein